jgi:hypothetical protein
MENPWLGESGGCGLGLEIRAEGLKVALLKNFGNANNFYA